MNSGIYGVLWHGAFHLINNRIHRPKPHRQCQIKAHRKSLKEYDKNPESTHNITETDKESLNSPTKSPKDLTYYKGPGGAMSGRPYGSVEGKKPQIIQGAASLMQEAPLRTLNPTKHLRAGGQERTKCGAEPVLLTT